MKSFLLAVIGVLFLFPSPEAEAQQWILCDTCQSSTDFEQVALQNSPAAPNSTYLFAVGNTISGKLRFVEVTTFNEGGPGGGGVDPLRAHPTKPSGRKDRISTSSVVFQVVSVEADAEDEQMFQEIVHQASDEPVAPPPPESWGESFDSFASLNLQLVSKYLWAFKTAHDPTWQARATTSLFKALWNALESVRGKGPSACMVFRNGDSACFQLNPLADSAARYISGTAITITGIDIPSAPSGGGLGDGEPLTLHNNLNEYRWTNGEELWLVCAKQGGTLLGCYYIYLPAQ